VLKSNYLEWKEEEVNFALQRLRKFWEYALSVIEFPMKEKTEYSFLSKVFIASVKTNLGKAIEAIERFSAREYILDGYYTNVRTIDEYHKFAKHLPEAEKKAALREVIDMMVVTMAPVIPHISEELNERMGNKDYISLKQIPDMKVDDKDLLYALQARYMADLIDDIDQIVKLVKSKPKKIHIYVNAEWKNELYELANKIFKEEAVQINKIMTSAKENTKLSKYMKEIANEAKLMIKDPTIFRIEMLGAKDQEDAILGYKEFISSRFGDAEILIHLSDDKEIHDPQNKAQKARPMKPALLLE